MTPGSPVLALVFVATLLAVTVTDLDRRVIPNRILAPSAAVAIAGLAIVTPGDLPEHLAAAAIAFGFLLAVALLRPRGMGMGDVKLAGLIGLYLGAATAAAMLIAFGTGALYGLALIVRHGFAARRRALPFGPFLALGGIAGMFAGDAIADWYIGGPLGGAG